METRFVVRPNGPLSGSVKVSGMAKNSGTKQMAAALLARGETVIHNIPRVSDIDVMADLLQAIGAKAVWTGPEEITVDAASELQPEAPYELVTRMRASVNVLGPLLARCGEARVSLPGGDAIGSRRLDMHCRGLQEMGAEIDISHGFVQARCDGLRGARIVLEFPSIGATENLLTAAVLAKGTTVIENAAREPEVTDLSSMLTRMGAEISGTGTSTIEIQGVDALSPIETELVGDRIEAGTLLMACGVVGGEIILEGTRLDHLEMVVMKLTEMGMLISPTQNGLWARATGRLNAVDIATLPYPGFATDYMPMAVALLSVSDGTAIVTENVYDNRFGFVDELARLGADVRVEGRHAVVRGVERLSGAPVRALDVRAGAALVLAGLAADSETEILDVHHIDRGYPDLPEKLNALGADISRTQIPG